MIYRNNNSSIPNNPTYLTVYGNVKAYIGRDEGVIPHFHVNYLGLKTAILLYESKYFIHNESLSMIHSKKEFNRLIAWLKSPSAKNLNITNWDELHMIWHTHYKNMGQVYVNNIPENPVMPDYYYNMPNYK